jgi:hypothetical protein
MDTLTALIPVDHFSLSGEINPSSNSSKEARRTVCGDADEQGAEVLPAIDRVCDTYGAGIAKRAIQSEARLGKEQVNPCDHDMQTRGARHMAHFLRSNDTMLTGRVWPRP